MTALEEKQMIVEIPSKASLMSFFTKPVNSRVKGQNQVVHFLNYQLLAGSFKEIANSIFALLASRQSEPSILVHVNMNNFYLLERSGLLKKLVQENSILLFDGIGMKLTSFLLNRKIYTDTNGTDLFPVVMEKAKENHLRIFLLGSEEDTIEQAVQTINKNFPHIEIVGYRDGYFNSEDESEIISQINNAGADILLIGMGCPLQEFFSLRNRRKLKTSLIWNVGGLFDFVSGKRSRAPLFIRKLRLEWLHRLCLHPKLLWKRNVVIHFLFFKYVLGRALFKKNGVNNG